MRPPYAPPYVPNELPDLVYQFPCGLFVRLDAIVTATMDDDGIDTKVTIRLHSGGVTCTHLASGEGYDREIEAERFRVAWIRAVAPHQWAREQSERNNRPSTVEGQTEGGASGAVPGAQQGSSRAPSSDPIEESP